jgi:hypothetical protein
VTYLIDTSVWGHRHQQAVAIRWRSVVEADEAAVCGLVRMEMLYTARSADEYDDLSDELGALHFIATGADAITRAGEVQQALAHVGGTHHRVAGVVDLVVAATAEIAGVPILHYDADYEAIAAVTGQPVEWVAPRGSL